MALDKLIVMDDVSGLADKPEAFVYFLTVSRKFGITCVYVFHTIYPTRQNWQIMLSQTKLIKIFSGSVQTSFIIGILASFCSLYKYTYVPKRNLWINRFYFDISNSTNKQCLRINTTDINDLTPAKFRTQADCNKEQICYYNRNKRDTSFNSFLAVRMQTSSANEIIFSIVNLIDKTIRNGSIYFAINDEVIDFKNYNIKYERRIQRVSESNSVSRTKTDGTDKRKSRNGRRISKKPRFLLIRLQKGNILQQELNEEIFYQILLMLVLIKRTCTMKILFLTFIC